MEGGSDWRKVISGANTTTGNDLYVQDLTKPNSPLVNLVDNFDSQVSVLDDIEGKLILYTNYKAPHFKLVTTDPNNTNPLLWKDLIPENNFLLTATTAGGKIFAQYLKDAITQVFQYSMDGTKIPMLITYKKGTVMNGKNPTLLYAYGGFGINITPAFSTSNIILLEKGGIYAVPNIHGGGEYGENWHLAGTKMKKQNVFDDFIAAAQYLIDQKYTSQEYLAISGASNGGLLIGATITQRPDLCKVAFPAVGVMDMLRYHKFSAGAGWSYDFGTSEDSKEMFEYLYGYSPYHSLKPNVYPATLITTADHDDRVVPAHSFKFAFRMQEDQKGNLPILIRIETKAGHGSGKSTEQIINELIDKWSFMFQNMGINY